MELFGYILRASYYKLVDERSCEVNALPIQTFGDSSVVRIRLGEGWQSGRTFRAAKKNKVFLVWNNPEAKLRLIHDGAWITLQRIKLPPHRGR